MRFEGNANTVNIQYNSIHNNAGPGVAADSSGVSGDSSGFVVNNNDIYSNNGIGLLTIANAYDGPVIAVNDWWGTRPALAAMVREPARRSGRTASAATASRRGARRVARSPSPRGPRHSSTSPRFPHRRRRLGLNATDRVFIPDRPDLDATDEHRAQPAHPALDRRRELHDDRDRFLRSSIRTPIRACARWATPIASSLPIRPATRRRAMSRRPLPTSPNSCDRDGDIADPRHRRWSDNAAGVENGFIIQRSTDGVNFTLVGTVATGVTTFCRHHGAGGQHLSLSRDRDRYRPATPLQARPRPRRRRPPMHSRPPLSSLNWSSATTGYGTVQKNRPSAATRSQLRGTTYATGIGTHAASTIDYNLAGNTRTSSRMSASTMKKSARAPVRSISRSSATARCCSIPAC